jgi:biotin operon repressor
MLSTIFGSPRRQRLCSLLVQNPDRGFTHGELARALGVSERTLAKDIRLLVDEDIVTRADNEYSIASTFPLLAELQSLFLKTTAMLHGQCIAELKGMNGLGLIILTGRFVMRPDCPIDLLLVGSLNRRKLQRLMHRLECDGISLNYTLLSRRAFETRWSITDRFLYGIFEGKHEILLDKWGLVSVAEAS